MSAQRRRPANRRGAMLLEVTVALAMLAVAGVALLGMAVRSEQAVVQSRDVGREVQLANGFMESVALWGRVDLDRHLGTRNEGRFTMRVERPTPTLYRVMLFEPADRDGAPRALLATTLFRPVNQ